MSEDAFSIEKLLAQKFEIPELKEPKSQQELTEQLAIISEITERCERILSHLILSKGFDCKEMSEYIEAHIQLIGMKNQLVKKQKWMEQGSSKQNYGIDGDQTLDSLEKS